MALRKTAAVLRVGHRKNGLYERVDFPSVYLKSDDKWAPKQMWNRFSLMRPDLMHSYPVTSINEEYQGIRGYKIYSASVNRWPHALKERSRNGWNIHGKEEGYATYKSLIEKMYQTGELEGELGEMTPQTIMQTWFGKRVQHRRTLTWSEKITRHRIFPHIYGWNQDAAAETVYSELLDHSFRPAIDHDALVLMESYGGLDQFILQNDPMFLTSWELETIRNYLLVRRMEMDKNHVMERQAAALADYLHALIREKHARKSGTRDAGTVPPPPKTDPEPPVTE